MSSSICKSLFSFCNFLLGYHFQMIMNKQYRWQILKYWLFYIQVCIQNSDKYFGYLETKMLRNRFSQNFEECFGNGLWCNFIPVTLYTDFWTVRWKQTISCLFSKAIFKKSFEWLFLWIPVTMFFWFI